MKIWAITVSVLLAGAVGAGVFFYLDLSGDLDTANADIETLEGEKATLEGNISGLETELADTEATLADTEAALDDVETELADTEAEVSTLEADLVTAQSRANSLQSQLSTAQGKYDSLKQKVDGCSPYGEILEMYYFVPSFNFTVFDILVMTSMVDDTGDAELMELWDAWLDNDTTENATAFWIAVWDGLWETLGGEGPSV